jgi:hypothetical protein
MIIKIVGIIWAGIGGIGWITSCSSWLDSGKLGDHAANYAASETFFFRLIVYFFLFIFPGLILVHLGKKKK